MPCFFFYGTDDYKIELQIEKLKSELLDENFKFMNFRTFYSPAPAELSDICASTPLMFGNMITLIKVDNYFFKIKNRSVEFSDKQADYLAAILEKIPPAHTLIFTCVVPNGKKIDSRKRIFKVLSKSAKCTELNKFRSYDKDLIPYIAGMIKSKELSADTGVVKLLIQRLGTDLRLISSEIDKLKLGIYPAKKITEKNVEEFCVIKEDIFALTDLVASFDKNEVLRQYTAVCAKAHPLEILAWLQSTVKKMLFVKLNEKTMSAKNMAVVLKMQEYPVKLLMQKISRLSGDDIINLKHALTEAEYKIKTGKAFDNAYLLESVLLTGGKNV